LLFFFVVVVLCIIILIFINFLCTYAIRMIDFKASREVCCLEKKSFL